MKKIFNWLGKKSSIQPTLGYVALRPFFGQSDPDDPLYNLFKLKNGGRIAERAVFLSACFLAVATLPMTLPVSVSTLALGGSVAVAGKTVGVLTGKLTDLLVWDMNSRVIPRREKKKQAQQQPKKP
ncbi:MAG: hypothetical protein GC185_08340 [Alphaproteobacteria bacterium]|nr:hypothetical protein [Alphaproteobacteria bacterium]